MIITSRYKTSIAIQAQIEACIWHIMHGKQAPWPIQGPKVRVCPEDMLRILVAIIDLNMPMRDYQNNHIDGLFAGVLPWE